jgi:hypothetical protein
MPRPRPKHLLREVSRHGTVRWVVRIGQGPRIPMPGQYGSPEFNAAYPAAVRGEPAPPAARREDDIRSDGKGGFLIEIDRQTLDRLKAMRGPSESCGDVIGRLARADGA